MIAHIDQLTAIERADLERCENQIQAGFDRIGAALQEIREKRLYREYGTWAVYCRERWLKSSRRIDQLIAGSAIAAQINQARPDLPSPTNEYQVRTLAGQGSERAVRTWATATQVYGDSPTHQQVETTLERLNGDEPLPDPEAATKRLVEAAGYVRVTSLMQSSTLTPKQALALCDTLDGCETAVQQDVHSLDLRDPALIREVNRLYKSGRESYDEMVMSRCLQFEQGMISIQDATPKDVRRWLDWKHTSHRRLAMGDKIIRERQVCEVIVVKFGILGLKIAGIQHDLQVGDKVQVSLVRV